MMEERATGGRAAKATVKLARIGRHRRCRSREDAAAADDDADGECTKRLPDYLAICLLGSPKPACEQIL